MKERETEETMGDVDETHSRFLDTTDKTDKPDSPRKGSGTQRKSPPTLCARVAAGPTQCRLQRPRTSSRAGVEKRVSCAGTQEQEPCPTLRVRHSGPLSTHQTVWLLNSLRLC